jgi:hypothetical protein
MVPLCWHSKNLLSNRTTCAMAWLNVEWFNKMSSKSFTSFHNPNWSWFMNVASPHEISWANYLNFNAYTIVEHDPWQRDRTLMFNVHFLFKFPKVALNFSRNFSKLLNKVDWCSNKGANQARAMPDTKLPMDLIRISLVGYQWRWSQIPKRTWLTKPWNFECVPSNLLGRPIRGFFGWVVLLKCIPRRLKFDWFANEQQLIVVFDFLVQDS